MEKITLDEQLTLLLMHAPKGKAWAKAFDPESNLGKLFSAFAIEFYRMSDRFSSFYDEIQIRKTAKMISDWESSVSIPDSIFSNTVTIEKRRQQVEQKFANYGGVQLSSDFVRVASFFGYVVEVHAGKDELEFPLSFPIIFTASTKEIKHTIVVDLYGEGEQSQFPLAFPIVFSSGAGSFLKGVFDSLAPANCNVIIRVI